jgi:hypothetical protein
MWINNDVDLPGALVTAQREGRPWPLLGVADLLDRALD